MDCNNHTLKLLKYCNKNAICKADDEVGSVEQQNRELYREFQRVFCYDLALAKTVPLLKWSLRVTRLLINSGEEKAAKQTAK